jgi:hypothetical protein
VVAKIEVSVAGRCRKPRGVFVRMRLCSRLFTAAITYVDNGNFVVPMHDSEFIDAEGKLVE